MVDHLISVTPATVTNYQTYYWNKNRAYLPEAISCIVTEERNGEFELEMEYPITGINYDQLQLRNIIVAKPNPYSGEQGFRIYSITRPINGVVTVNAEHISYDLTGYPVSPFSAESLEATLAAIPENAPIETPFTFTTDKTSSAVLELTTPCSIRSLLGGMDGSILDIYGGEYEFDNYDVKLLESRGADRGVVVRYGKNLTDLEQEENCSNVYTGVYPYWYAEPDEDEDSDSDSDSDDSETSQKGLLELPEKYISASGTYDYERIYPLDLSSEWTEMPTEDELRERAKEYMSENNIGVPKVSLTVSFVQLSQSSEYSEYAALEKIQLCDTVGVEFPALGVSTSAKCIKTVYNAVTGKYESIELGDATSSLESTLSSQSQSISSNASAAASNAVDIQAAAASITELTAQYAEIQSLYATVAYVESLQATYATIESLNADIADINDLFASYATITYLQTNYALIDDLTAATARIADLEANTATIAYLQAYYATIDQLDAAYADISTLTSDVASIQALFADYATINYLQSNYALITDLTSATARIATLEANTATIAYLQANYATIGQLDTVSANITALDTDIASIRTLLAGNESVETLQAIHLTSDNVVIDDAIINDAMIVSLTADKLTSGTIYTDYITIANNTGENLLIDGSTIQISDGTYVRVQIGEDGTGDYNLYLWNAEGTLIWNAQGLTEDGLTGNGAIIKDMAVADDAAISGYKIDMETMTSALNDYGQLVVEASQVTIDNTTLDYKLTTITTATSEAMAAAEAAAALQTEAVKNLTQYYTITDSADTTPDSPTTAAIADYAICDLATVDVEDVEWTTEQPTVTDGEYLWTAFLVEYLDGTTEWTTPTCLSDGVARSAVSTLRTEFEVVQGQITAKIWQTDIDTAVSELDGEITTLSDKYTTVTETLSGIETDIGNITTTVSENYTTLTSQITTISETVDGITVDISDIESTVAGNYTDLSSQIASLTLTTTGLSASFSSLQETIETNYSDLQADSVKKITQYYAVNDSAETAPNDPTTAAIADLAICDLATVDVEDVAWTTTQPTVTDGEYLWTAFLVEHLDGTTEWTTPTCLSDGVARSAVSTLRTEFEVTTEEITGSISKLESTIDDNYSVLSSQYATVTETISGIKTDIGDITTTVAENYTKLDNRVTTIKATSDEIISEVSSLSTTVSDNYDTCISYTETTYQQLADSIVLSVGSSSGGKATISLTVDGSTSGSGSVVTSARTAFANESSSITISAGTITFSSNTLIVNSDQLTLDGSGNATFSGELNAATGTFYGDITTYCGVYLGGNLAVYKNYISNGDFVGYSSSWDSASSTGWTRSSSTYVYGATYNGVDCAYMSGAGTNYYMRRYISDGIPAGTYIIKARIAAASATAAANAYARVRLGTTSSGTYGYLCSSGDLTTDWQTYYTIITTTSTSYYLYVYPYGGTSYAYYITDVSVINVEEISGYIGYLTGSANGTATDGIGVMNSTKQNYFIATTAGARMSAGESDINVVTDAGINLNTSSTIMASVAITVSSDRALKNHVETLPDAYETLFDRMEPVRYYLNHEQNSRYHLGYIANDVLEAAADAGLTWDDIALVNQSSETGLLGLNYTEIISLQHHKIKKLERRIEALERSSLWQSQAN